MSELSEYPICRSEISAWFYWEKDGKNIYVIGNKEIDKYLTVDENHLKVVLYAVRLMNGSNSILAITNKIRDDLQVELDVEDLVKRLSNAGLLNSQKGVESNELAMFSKRMVNIQFKEINPRKRKLCCFFWYTLFLFSIGLIISAFAALVLNIEKLGRLWEKCFTFNDSYLLGGVITAVVSVITIFFHESAHAITSIKCGLQPSSFSVHLYGGFKLLWMVKIKGMYTVNRKKRIMIMGAGIYTNFIIICLFINICLLGGLTDHGLEICSKFLINNLFMIIACSTPFNLSDGYYIISQLTKRTNMRKKMFSLLSLRREAFRRADAWDVLYALISTGMILYSFYLTAVWCYHIALEIYKKTEPFVINSWVAGMIATVPILIIAWIEYGFVKRFVRLIRANS